MIESQTITLQFSPLTINQSGPRDQSTGPRATIGRFAVYSGRKSIVPMVTTEYFSFVAMVIEEYRFLKSQSIFSSNLTATLPTPESQ